jgi:hypothetical protein
MTPLGIVLALNLIALPGAHGRTVYINPQEVVSIRAPVPGAKSHAPDIHCLIQTSDGHIVASTDMCDVVADKLNVGKPYGHPGRGHPPCVLVCGGERS